jgi:hypothetical protein
MYEKFELMPKSWLLTYTDTLSEIKLMLQQKEDLIGTSIHATRSLRSENPIIRVATSVNVTKSKTGSICSSDTASIVAPSDLELEFDDIIINSQTYGRLLAQAQAKPRIESLEELDDLIGFANDDTVREEESSVFGTPEALRGLD